MSKQAWTKETWAWAVTCRAGQDSDFIVCCFRDEASIECDRQMDSLEEGDDWECKIVPLLPTPEAFADIPDPEAFMAAHDKLVAACERHGEDYDPYEDGECHSTDGVLEALAAVKDAS